MNGRPETGAVARARLHSPYLALQLNSFPEVAAALSAGDYEGALALAAKEGEAVPAALGIRRERNALALAVGVGDLAGVFPFERVVSLLSDLADRTLERAIRAAIEERTPGAEPRGFVILSLGKHGSREINYSSDVDLIFLYDP
ncbi:MAG TPA: glutamine-synthetase adenylyltransferase, partial [Allosphingosinicella sp.]